MQLAGAGSAEETVSSGIGLENGLTVAAVSQGNP
jgi:hypothetical protein